MEFSIFGERVRDGRERENNFLLSMREINNNVSDCVIALKACRTL